MVGWTHFFFTGLGKRKDRETFTMTKKNLPHRLIQCLICMFNNTPTLRNMQIKLVCTVSSFAYKYLKVCKHEWIAGSWRQERFYLNRHISHCFIFVQSWWNYFSKYQDILKYSSMKNGCISILVIRHDRVDEKCPIVGKKPNRSERWPRCTKC